MRLMNDTHLLIFELTFDHTNLYCPSLEVLRADQDRAHT